VPVTAEDKAAEYMRNKYKKRSINFFGNYKTEL